MRLSFTLFLLFLQLCTFSQNAILLKLRISYIEIPKLPGSGNTLQFNGTNQYVEIPDADNINDFSTSQNFTVECWTKVNSVQTNTAAADNCIIEKWSSANSYPYVIRYYNQTAGTNSGKIWVLRYDGTNNPFLTSSVSINDNQWHHIAFVRSGGTTGTLSLYIDGVLQGSTSDNTTSATTNTSSLFFGRRGGATPNYFNGQIDEVRIWNTGLTETQIRQRMCTKVIPADLLYSNLSAYYNFDETSGTYLTDSKNSIDGIHSNNPLRLPSGASIGNSSSFIYGGSNSSLTHVQPVRGDKLTTTLTAGSSAGIHIYNVNEKPNTENGVIGAGTNSSYFGVFTANGVNSQYTAVYNYAGISIAGNENDLHLYKRSSNADNAWIDAAATLNTTAKTLTCEGQNTEYMVGSVGKALPVSLVSFQGINQGQIVSLKWQTEHELNVSHFDVEISHDGLSFEKVNMLTAKGSARRNMYEAIDNSIWLNDKKYYRLKIIDNDYKFKYSSIILLSRATTNGLSFFPNPVRHTLSLNNINRPGTISIMNTEGKIVLQKMVREGSQIIDVHTLPKGIYILKYQSVTETSTYKLYKE